MVDLANDDGSKWPEQHHGGLETRARQRVLGLLAALRNPQFTPLGFRFQGLGLRLEGLALRA